MIEQLEVEYLFRNALERAMRASQEISPDKKLVTPVIENFLIRNMQHFGFPEGLELMNAYAVGLTIGSMSIEENPGDPDAPHMGVWDDRGNMVLLVELMPAGDFRTVESESLNCTMVKKI